MNIGIRLCQVQELELGWKGDMAQSVFVRTEELLRDGDFQKALEFVAPQRKMRPYRDMIDFLFCELVLCFRADCFRYYRGQGPQLRNHPRATPERLAEWDAFLVASLHVAHAAMDRNRQLSWRQFRNATETAFRRTG